jgi:hypothetical protein
MSGQATSAGRGERSPLFQVEIVAIKLLPASPAKAAVKEARLGEPGSSRSCVRRLPGGPCGNRARRKLLVGGLVPK